MIVYIDSNFHCHTTNPDGAFREVETEFFDGKCQTFIEGYLFVPAGESWTLTDGTVVHGEMITPWKPYSELDQAQRQFERELAQAARILLGEV